LLKHRVEKPPPSRSAKTKKIETGFSPAASAAPRNKHSPPCNDFDVIGDEILQKSGARSLAAHAEDGSIGEKCGVHRDFFDRFACKLGARHVRPGSGAGQARRMDCGNMADTYDLILCRRQWSRPPVGIVQRDIGVRRRQDREDRRSRASLRGAK